MTATRAVALIGLVAGMSLVGPVKTAKAVPIDYKWQWTDANGDCKSACDILLFACPCLSISF